MGWPGLGAAQGEDHAHALGAEPPGREHQGLGGRAVQPVRVVDRDYDRPGLGGGSQEGQGRDRDGEALVPASGTRAGRGAGTEGERSLQRPRLGARQDVDEPAERPGHVGQPAVRDLGFCLKTTGLN